MREKESFHACAHSIRPTNSVEERNDDRAVCTSPRGRGSGLADPRVAYLLRFSEAYNEDRSRFGALEGGRQKDIARAPAKRSIGERVFEHGSKA
jgi:hypothetical protein